ESGGQRIHVHLHAARSARRQEFGRLGVGCASTQLVTKLCHSRSQAPAATAWTLADTNAASTKRRSPSPVTALPRSKVDGIMYGPYSKRPQREDNACVSAPLFRVPRYSVSDSRSSPPYCSAYFPYCFRPKRSLRRGS